MAAITGAVVAGVATVGSAAIKANAAKKGAKSAAAAERAAAEERRRAQAQIEGYQQPYRDAGAPALNELMRVNSGDYSGFESSPDFQAALKYGGQARERSAAARGGLNSGNTLIGLEQFGQDTAAGYLGNYRNALMGQIGIGQGATNALSQVTANTASGVASNLVGEGDSRASGIVGGANAWGDGFEDVAGVAGDYYGNKLLKKPPPVKINPRTLPRVGVTY